MPTNTNTGDSLAVTLTPVQAKQVAGTIRIELGSQCEGIWGTPLLDRAELIKLRALLNHYCDQLEMLEWGEPARDVALQCSKDALEELAESLRQGGEECIEAAKDLGCGDEQGQAMIAAALAISRAVEEDHAGLPAV